MGYYRAGFDVIGVDIKPQPHYPFTFVQADALAPPFDLSNFEVIHASPPCQFFTQMRASWRAQGHNDGYCDYLTSTLKRLRATEVPYVVENVVGARQAMGTTITLHGGMFGLRVYRPRLFASNLLLLAPPPTPRPDDLVGVYDSRPRGTTHYRTRLNGNGRGRSPMRIARTLEEGQAAMDIDWMEWLELKESIPPAYTEFIGRQLQAQLVSV